MSGKKSPLTPLEARKQLLLVESELNRMQLLNDVRDFKNEIHQLKQHVAEISSAGFVVAKLATAFATIGNTSPHHAKSQENETSWISTSLDVVKAGLSIWRLLGSGRNKP